MTATERATMEAARDALAKAWTERFNGGGTGCSACRARSFLSDNGVFTHAPTCLITQLNATLAGPSRPFIEPTDDEIATWIQGSTVVALRTFHQRVKHVDPCPLSELRDALKAAALRATGVAK